MSFNKCAGYSSVLTILFFTQCALLATKNVEVTEKQKEEDLIELLNAKQQMQSTESRQNGSPDDLSNQIAGLEQNNSKLMEENNLLKSDLLILNERLRQIENELTSYEIRYQNALQMFHNSKYRDALSGFSDLISENRGHSLSDNCQYWIGECYFALKEFSQAIIAFEKVFTFLNSNKDDDAQFKLGYTYLKLGDGKRAEEEFIKLSTNYSDSEFVSRAQTYLNQMQ